MEHWDLSTLDVEPHKPQVLHSTRGEARSITLLLPAGEQLQDHQVHERAHVVVIDGEVEIEIDGRTVRREGPGSSFGEIALLRDVPRTASVRAVSDVRLLALERDVFLSAVTGHVRSRSVADAVVAERMGSG